MAIALPPISVLIPAYNAEATLMRAIDSVAAQGHAPIEIIVVDDASRDSTAAIAEAYDRPSVRLIRHTENRGAAAALNTAIEAATHELIAFLDADDEWLPGKLAAQVALIDQAPDLVLVATGFAAISVHGSLLYDYGLAPFAHQGRDFWRNLLVDAAIKKSSVLTRRRLVLAVGGFDVSLRVAEDQDLFLRLAALGPVGYVHERLVHYHETPGSLTKRAKSNDRRIVLPLIERHLAALGSRLTSSERRAVLARRTGNAAANLLGAGDWLGGAPLALRAIAYGDRPAAHLWRLFTTFPPVRAAKHLLRAV